MTFKEKLAMEPKEKLVEIAVEARCPESFGYEIEIKCMRDDDGHLDCASCWNREMPEEPDDDRVSLAEASKNATEAFKNLAISMGEAEPHILDSGDRTEFETGAVRDMREGKGRCDLLPLDVVAEFINICEHDKALGNISCFQDTGNYNYLINCFIHDNIKVFYGESIYTIILEVAKHFEEGAKKYGDNNWRKGIPVRCYIDSAVRHYLKYLRGDKDEPHDRAFCWNILCAIWTCKHMPELNDYAKKEEVKENNENS